MRLIYNVLFDIGFLLSAPFYFLKMHRRGSWADGFWERFGHYPAKLKQALTNRRTIWVHAVSVGEAAICGRLIESLSSRLPNHKFVVSTTTSTGMAELRRRLPAEVSKIYYPIDRRKHVQRALGMVNPEAMVFIEAEIWPNMIWGLQRRGIPYFLVNARISDRSYRGYRWARRLFGPFFKGFAGIGAQNQADAERLQDLGARPETIQVVGSLKFDGGGTAHARLDARALLDQLGVPDKALVLVAGSTHSGEEAIIASVASRLRERFPDLFLILVPRHHERGGEVGKELGRLKVPFVYRSEITPKTRKTPGSIHCLLVNTTGELRYFYGVADLVFIGKSLTAHGGQNPIEPATLAKPVLFGPHMENFAQIVPQFLDQGGALQVADEAALERAIGDLLADPARRQLMGQRAAQVVQANQGGLEKTVQMVVSAIEV
jgi:3-deoxy-D-manno-octulosonic-acid transferase